MTRISSSLLALALIAGAALALMPSASANDGLPVDEFPICTYNLVITDSPCKRLVVEVANLPEGVDTYNGIVRGFQAVCAHIGKTQTWCVVSETPVIEEIETDDGPADSNPCPAGTSLFDHDVLGIVCRTDEIADAVTVSAPVPSFTG